MTVAVGIQKIANVVHVGEQKISGDGCIGDCMDRCLPFIVILFVAITSSTVQAYTSYPAISMATEGSQVCKLNIDVTSGENLTGCLNFTIASLGDQNTTVEFTIFFQSQNISLLSVEFANENYTRMLQNNGSVTFPPHSGSEYIFSVSYIANRSSVSHFSGGTVRANVTAWNGTSPPPSEASSNVNFLIEVVNNSLPISQDSPQIVEEEPFLIHLPVPQIMICIALSVLIKSFYPPQDS